MLLKDVVYQQLDAHDIMHGTCTHSIQCMPKLDNDE